MYFLFLFSDHQTTPMMNGEHHSDKSTDHSSSIKVLIRIKNYFYGFIKISNSLKNPSQQHRISYMLMLIMYKGRKIDFALTC